MKKTAIVKASDYDLDEQKAGEIQASFEPMIVERKVLAKEYEAIRKLDIDADVCKRAGTLRKALVKVRTGIDGIHKAQKHLFLMAGRFVDAWKNAETLPVTQMEEQLRDIEEHFENIEAERIAKICEARQEELRKYEVQDESFPAYLGQMDDDVWSNYIAGVKIVYDQRKDAEAKAEKERIAQEKATAEECERLRIESEKLKKEAEAARKREAAAEAKRKAAWAKQEAEAARRAKAESARIAVAAKAVKKMEDAAKKKRKAAEAKMESERIAATAKLIAEREKRELLEREKKDREEAEREEREAVEAREKDTAHRKTVNNAIVDALMATEPRLLRPACVKIVKAIVKGDIPNVSVNY